MAECYLPPPPASQNAAVETMQDLQVTVHGTNRCIEQLHIGRKNYKLYNLQYFVNISSFRKYRSMWDIKHFIYQNYVQMDKETSVNVSAEDKQAKNIERDN